LLSLSPFFPFHIFRIQYFKGENFSFAFFLGVRLAIVSLALIVLALAGERLIQTLPALGLALKKVPHTRQLFIPLPCLMVTSSGVLRYFLHRGQKFRINILQTTPCFHTLDERTIQDREEVGDNLL